MLIYWIVNCSRIFIDIDVRNLPEPIREFYTALAILVVLFTVTAVLIVLKEGQKLPKNYLLYTAIGYPVVLAVVDIFAGGSRSAQMRYLTPALVGFPIIAAFAIDRGLQAKIPVGRKVAHCWAICLLIMGVVSCCEICQADHWRTKSHIAKDRAIGAYCNQQPHAALVMIDCPYGVVLSQYLRGDVNIYIAPLRRFKEQALAPVVGTKLVLPPAYSPYILSGFFDRFSSSVPKFAATLGFLAMPVPNVADCFTVVPMSDFDFKNRARPVGPEAVLWQKM